MAADETALILVQLDESTDSVIEKVLSSGAVSIQILVPDGATALRTVAQTNRLRQMAEDSRIDLSLISSDPAIIGAAWISRIQILVVCNTHVVAAVPAPQVVAQPPQRDLPTDTVDVPHSAPPPDPKLSPTATRSPTTPAPRQRADHRALHSALPRPKGSASNRSRSRRGGAK